MNFAEKLAATYLRLNGFLLLPQFTVFAGERHNHIDLIGLRAANSQERVGDFILPIDDTFFRAITHLHRRDALSSTIGVAAEVRTNDRRDVPTTEHLDYVRNFLGGLPVYRLSLFEGRHTVEETDDGLDIGMRYMALWIRDRIEKMNERLRLTKDGSWNWSESFLGDLIVLRRYDLLPKNRSE